MTYLESMCTLAMREGRALGLEQAAFLGSYVRDPGDWHVAIARAAHEWARYEAHARGYAAERLAKAFHDACIGAVEELQQIARGEG